MFNYGNDDDRLDLSDPWYKNEGLVSGLLFFVLLAIGLVILVLLKVWLG